MSETLHRLQSPTGLALQAQLRDLNPTPATALAIATRLRRTNHYPADLVAAAMTLHELRTRAAEKFSRAEALYLTRDGLEQATAEPIARYRAARFAGRGRLADLCCGIGGDLIALAAEHDVLAVDRDPAHLAMALANAAAYGVADRVTPLEADVRTVDLTGIDGVFIDPARRTSHRRLPAGASEPPLAWCLGLAERVVAVDIKAAPGIDHALVPHGWELELIALGPDLKEASLWSPALATATRRATVVTPSGPVSLAPVPGEPIPIREPGAYLLDPNPAVTRAGLVADLARALPTTAWQLDPQIAFLSTDAPVASPFARTLRIVASLPWHEKRLRARLRELDAGPVTIRRRGLPGDVDALTKRLRGPGPNPFTVAITRLAGKPWGLVCEEPTP
jgi:hypothetical protein